MSDSNAVVACSTHTDLCAMQGKGSLPGLVQASVQLSPEIDEAERQS
jgi:hypothetical protein